jgi:hypothetical protein
MSEATPEQIARFGHVAVLLRRYLETTGMSMADFGEHVLGSRKTTSHYPWVGAKQMPGPTSRQRIGRVLGVPASYLLARDPEADPSKYPPEPQQLKVPDSWTRLRLAQAQPVTAAPPRQPDRPAARRDILSFQLHDDGTASVRLVADNLPAEHAKSLLRVLLEAGLPLRDERLAAE